MIGCIKKEETMTSTQMSTPSTKGSNRIMIAPSRNFITSYMIHQISSVMELSEESSQTGGASLVFVDAGYEISRVVWRSVDE